MIKGIGGRPYIGLDEHIDIEGFRKLHPEICRGFALAREYAKDCLLYTSPSPRDS